MKTNLLLLLITVTLSTFSQITITHSDYSNGFAVGSNYTSYATPLNGPILTVFVGEPSGNSQTWDFSDYDFILAGDGISIDPASAPFYSSFPGCNAVMFEKTYGLKDDTLYSYTYQELSSDQLLLHGLSDENEIAFTWDPPAIQAEIPCTYGTTWQEDWDSTWYMPEVWIISKTEVEVDAFGSMILPSGEYPCLRLTSYNYMISHTPVGTDSLMTKGYHWYAKDLTEVHITTVNEDQFELSTIEVGAFSYAKAGGPAGIAENNSPIIDLNQNYPNPFYAKTTISYSLSEPEEVSLMVYDITGRELDILVNEKQSAGQYEVDFSGGELDPGTYFYQLKTDSYSVIRKMIITR